MLRIRRTSCSPEVMDPDTRATAVNQEARLNAGQAPLRRLISAPCDQLWDVIQLDPILSTITDVFKHEHLNKNLVFQRKFFYVKIKNHL